MAELWDLWFPQAGSTGVSFARSRVDPAEVGERLLVHAPPPRLDVTVTDDDGAVRARGRALERHEEGPMAYLVRRDGKVDLEDGWPDDDDVGRVVILPGGEAGTLVSWWHAPDRSEWRWRVEFSNHR